MSTEDNFFDGQPDSVVRLFSKIGAYRIEIRRLGDLLAGASDRQLDSMLPSFDAALEAAGLEADRLPKFLFDLRRKLEDMEH
jgi:hypothetical protein